MPNWATNTVRIVSTEDVIDQLEEHKLSFNHFVPRPESEEENWYNWNLENWGTKWDINDDDLMIDRQDEEIINFEFLTAWSPPIKFFHNLAKLFKKIYIECNYYEEGNGFKGYLIITKCDNILKVRDFTWSPPFSNDGIDHNLNMESNETEEESLFIETNKNLESDKEKYNITI
jgi:hypothetical protein